MKFNKRFKNKKGQGLPLNTIIIAIIVIVVLVVIILIFSGNILHFQSAANADQQCRAAHGVCVKDAATCKSLGGKPVPNSGSYCSETTGNLVYTCCSY